MGHGQNLFIARRLSSPLHVQRLHLRLQRCDLQFGLVDAHNQVIPFALQHGVAVAVGIAVVHLLVLLLLLLLLLHRLVSAARWRGRLFDFGRLLLRALKILACASGFKEKTTY